MSEFEAPITNIEITKKLFRRVVMYSAYYEVQTEDVDLPCHMKMFTNKKEMLEWLDGAIDEMEVQE